MKKYIYILISALMVTACSDGLDEPRTIQAGESIRFTASTDAITRTIYGDKNAQGNYPIYWEDGDLVKIFCPQADAAKGVQEAEFTVSNPGENSTSYALSGMNSMVWGEGDGEQGTHDFYMFYPSSQLVSFANDGVNGELKFDLPAEQVVTMTQNGTAWEGINTDYALMAGHMAINRTETSDTDVINLQFKPITTALEINITAPSDGDTQYLTSITIANESGITTGREALAGTTIYDITSTDDADWNEPSSTDVINGSAAVRITFQDADGNPLNIALAAGSGTTVKVPAFLRPVLSQIYGLRVILNMRESVTVGASDTHTKSIPQGKLIERKFNTMAMGNIPCPPEFTYETWMSNLPDDTYVSQMSLPGTHDAACSGTDYNSTVETQQYGIEEQLNRGVRVLDFRPDYQSDGSFDISHGFYNTGVTFQAVMEYAVSWLASHPTEFIIIKLKNETTNSSLTDYFEKWQLNIRAEILKYISPEYYIDIFDPEMTLGEARGKVLFMSRDEYDGGYLGCKIAGWPDNSAEVWTRTFYINKEGYRGNAYYGDTDGVGVGMAYVSDYYNFAKGSIISNIDLAEALPNKTEALTASLSGAGNNKTYSNWYITYTSGFFYAGSTAFSQAKNYACATAINEWTAAYIKSMSTSTAYKNAGIVIMDYADNEGANGDDLLKAVIDNNFKGGGPLKKDE